ncbi:hypothetical protein J3E68DRAFT_417170 [Trichoderma sp. SZMC 28012]
MQLGINFKISNTRSKGSQRPKGKKSKTTRKSKHPHTNFVDSKENLSRTFGE